MLGQHQLLLLIRKLQSSWSFYQLYHSDAEVAEDSRWVRRATSLLVGLSFLEST